MPAPTSVWYGCMTTQPSSAQKRSRRAIMSWKLSALIERTCYGSRSITLSFGVPNPKRA